MRWRRRREERHGMMERTMDSPSKTPRESRSGRGDGDNRSFPTARRMRSLRRRRRMRRTGRQKKWGHGVVVVGGWW